jgi:hypothetical protein
VSPPAPGQRRRRAPCASNADTLPAALPAAHALNWSIIGLTHGCSVAADPADAHALLTIGRSAVTVTVQVADASGAHRARIAVVVT